MADLRAFLRKLQENLNILREREAKYAGNAPLDLLNQIKDHEQAIILTEQALAGEITEREWNVVLKPLLVSLDKARVIIDQQKQQVEQRAGYAGRIPARIYRSEHCILASLRDHQTSPQRA